MSGCQGDKKGRGRPPLSEEEKEQRKLLWEFVSARLPVEDAMYLRSYHPTGSYADAIGALLTRCRKLWPKGGCIGPPIVKKRGKRRKKKRRDRQPDAFTKRTGTIINTEGGN